VTSAYKHSVTKKGKKHIVLLITLEGGIGAGKSFLTKQLSDLTGARAMFEPVEENPYLERFYKDPKRYALEMQFWLLARRFQMHQEAIQHIWKTGESVIMDRSLDGDWVFAKKNWLDGNIDDLGYENYLKHRDVMNRFLLVPHTVVWLNAQPETCQVRIGTRGRDCEKSIPIEYLRGLHHLHEELMHEMKQRGSKIVVLDWDKFQRPEDVAEKLGLKLR
jgi:deoxyadenosine/deoxycytidine kinase